MTVGAAGRARSAPILTLSSPDDLANLTVGDQVVNSRMDKRLAEIRLALTGQIPDGLLFRISSIDNDPVRAFATQQKFAAEMMNSVPVEVRRQLSGLGAPANAS